MTDDRKVDDEAISLMVVSSIVVGYIHDIVRHGL